MNFCFWKEPIFRYKDKKKSTAMMDLFIDAAMENRQLLVPKYVCNLKYEDLIWNYFRGKGGIAHRTDTIFY